MLRKSELEAIHQTLGGKFSFKERLKRDRTGTPFLYYIGGHPGIDELNERAVDELRIVFEEFKNGLMLTATERTEPYIMPLRPEEVQRISIRLSEEKVDPRPGSFFHWLLRRGVGMRFSRFFAGASEYEEAKTMFEIDIPGHTIRAWKTEEEFAQLANFFEKSQFAERVEVSR